VRPRLSHVPISQGTADGPDAYHISVAGVFAAGDMRRLQSLVAWAICKGRQYAQNDQKRPESVLIFCAKYKTLRCIQR
jgi:hypothetical protein